MKHIALTLLILLACICAKAQNSYISFDKSNGGIDVTKCSIVYYDSEFEGVKIAANNLADDILDVTGVKPSINNQSADTKIIIGTLGNADIEKLVKKSKLNVTSIKGKWEAGMIAQIDAKTIAIIGADMRGTIFAVYDVSKTIGVSPWKFWADVPTQKHDYAALKLSSPVVFPSPKVKYRGIFLNDEAPCLSTWVNNTFPDEKCPSAVAGLA